MVKWWQRRAAAGGASAWLEEVDAGWDPEDRPAEPSLSAEHWQEIVAITDLEWDLDRFRALISETEEVLSLYPPLLEAMQDTPTLGQRLAYLEPLLQRAERLSAGLGASEYDALWFDFAVQGADLTALRAQLTELLDKLLTTGRRVVADLESTDPRQGSVEQVQQLLVADLRRVFDEYCSPILLEDEGLSNISRSRFVRLCLDAARVDASPAALAAAVKPRASLKELVGRSRRDGA